MQAQNSKRAALMLNIASALVSISAAYFIPSFFGFEAVGSSFKGSFITLIIAVGLFMVLRHVLQCRDARLRRVSFILGAIYAVITVPCEDLRKNGRFTMLDAGGVVTSIWMIFLLSLIFGCGALMLFEMTERLRCSDEQGAEPVYKKILGNGFFAFALLLICWLPVWLAFYPGAFSWDSTTQYCQYMDNMHVNHHPLLHTLFLGRLMDIGVELDPNGVETSGLAVYSAVQIVLIAGMLAYALHWLKRRRAPFWCRLLLMLFFALFPFYSLWPFNAQKDVLFGGLTLMLCLQLADLWIDDYNLLKSPLKLLRFAVIAVLMMLFRQNGVYAVCLLAPFAVVLAKKARIRTAALLAACVALYFLATYGLVTATEAESGDSVELYSIPLQQIARSMKDEPDSMTDEAQEVLESLYGDARIPEQVYNPLCSDIVKWNADYDTLNEDASPLLRLWLHMLPSHFRSYTEAFLVQNLPYLLPGSETNPDFGHFDTDIIPMELYLIEAHSYFPGLRDAYLQYDEKLEFLGIPGTKLLSQTATYIWLAFALVALSIYRKEKVLLAPVILLLAIWFTSLLGPVALIRYMLSIHYTIPVLLAAALIPKRNAECAQVADK